MLQEKFDANFQVTGIVRKTFGLLLVEKCATVIRSFSIFGAHHGRMEIMYNHIIP